MRIQKAKLVTTLGVGLVFTLLGCSAPDAGGAFPLAAGFGFDWLDPESASCERMDADMAKTAGDCEFQSTGAFGLELAYYECRRSETSTLLVFQSADACQQALETMQANAP
jgi:hypothetical protein